MVCFIQKSHFHVEKLINFYYFVFMYKIGMFEAENFFYVNYNFFIFKILILNSKIKVQNIYCMVYFYMSKLKDYISDHDEFKN